MGIFRWYAGQDGESHLEELDLASHPELTALHGAKGVVCRATPPGSFRDWHTAPRRQYLITLSGEAESGLGDGTIPRLGPGDVHMAADLTGPGHTTRVVGQVPRGTATIHIEGCSRCHVVRGAPRHRQGAPPSSESWCRRGAGATGARRRTCRAPTSDLAGA
jgi:hypothetical protein